MIEKILGLGLFAGFLIRDIFGFYDFDHGVLICGTLLAIQYLLGFWWINKPAETKFRTVFLTILYGLAFSCLTLTLVFKLLYLTGSDEMTVLSVTLTAFTILLDILFSIKAKRLAGKIIMTRLFLLAPVIGAYYFIAEDKRIEFTYRKNPNFLQFYHDQKDNYPTFYDLKKGYTAIEKLKNRKKINEL